MTRGVVVPLSLEQVAARARYLAGNAISAVLDDHVRSPEKLCAVGYYLLKEHNGGKDPTAPDPFDRWSRPGSSFVNVTADCIGGASWCGGWDRYQPERFAHLYGGWINTDSMLLDARGPAKCFVELPRPEPGCFVVCASGTPGHAVGHIGTVVGVPPEWDRKERDCWKLLEVVDVASTGAGKRANTLRTAIGWYGANASFVRSIMTP
jgi:hypothetical protein